MDVFDIISIQDAKDNTVIDYNEDDAIVARIIKTAIAWVEKYTCYYFYQRSITIPVSNYCEASTPYYPLANIVAKNKAGETVITNLRNGALRTYISGQYMYTLMADAGFTAVDDIPSPLIEAAYKMIAYLYDNRSSYTTTIPTDIQILINQYRRSATI